MTNRLLALASAVALGAGATACIQQDDTHPVAQVLPRAEDVRIALPDRASSRAPAVGELAEYYVATRGVTRTLNGGTAFVLVLVHTIVHFPPTSVDGATATWGPHADALDPAEWMLVVTERPDGTYDWHLDGRSRTVPGAQFETILAGNAGGDGTGHFTLDFDKAEEVNPIDNDGRGRITATYDIPARTLDLAVEAIEDRNGVPTAIQYDYAYAEDASGGGDMVFSIYADTEDAGPAPEELTLRSRWQADGSGRGDARIRSGDAPAEVVASECWSSSFLRVFYTDSATWQPTEGDATACAFADQDLP